MWSLKFVPLLCYGFAAAHVVARQASGTLPPSLDPFYTPPSNVASYAPGAIIRSRNTPGSLAALNQYTSENIKAAYQLLFRTTNTQGDPTAAVTTVIVPNQPSYGKVLHYLAPYDSADINCSPSYTLQQSSNDTSTSDVLFMAAALNNGWIVATPDYEGLTAAFVAGVGSGYAVLDSVRAVQASKKVTKVKTTAKYAIWGYSGGALGSEWSLELQPSYAPELHFVGAALGGLTPNATSVLLDVNNGPLSSLVFNGINGLMAAYPNLTEFINQELIPSKAAEFKSVTTACGNSSAPNMDFQDVFTYFQDGSDILLQPIPQSVTYWGATMGLHGIPTVPIYAYKAIDDEVSPVNDTDTLVAYYCSKGVSIEYLRNEAGEHISEAVTGAGGALAWLKMRFAGKKVMKGCTTKNVTVTDLSPATIKQFGPIISAGLELLLDQPVGEYSPAT